MITDTYNIDLQLNTEQIKSRLDDLKDALKELNLPYILNFYGCSFNFANDGCAEGRYYNGSDIYNQRKDEQE